jgi:hypothetical protein
MAITRTHTRWQSIWSVTSPPQLRDSQIMTNDLSETVAVFEHWLHVPDPVAIHAELGAVAANRLPGDPVWLALVGPPSSGKSELLAATCGLPDVHPAATLTEAALLSGTSKKERDASASGGLLREIGGFGIIMLKDFGSVLSMHRDQRAQVLAALREVYDGSWTRHLGTDGGLTLQWNGKVGLLAGCTGTIDKAHAVVGAMGERRVFCRLPEVEGKEQARKALAHAGQERKMRQDLMDAVERLFADSLPRDPRELNLGERDGLVALAELAVRCRSAVERDSYNREIDLIPASEAPSRLVVVLDRLLAGLDAIGLDRESAWQVVAKVALDSMPALRRALIDSLAAVDDPTETGAIATRVGYPDTTVRRGLEDLAAHGVVTRYTQGSGKKDTWSLSEWARERFRAALTLPERSGPSHADSVPETSADDRGGGVPEKSSSTNDAIDDISGTVDPDEEQALIRDQLPLWDDA